MAREVLKPFRNYERTTPDARERFDQYRDCSIVTSERPRMRGDLARIPARSGSARSGPDTPLGCPAAVSASGPLSRRPRAGTGSGRTRAGSGASCRSCGAHGGPRAGSDVDGATLPERPLEHPAEPVGGHLEDRTVRLRRIRAIPGKSQLEALPPRSNEQRIAPGPQSTQSAPAAPGADGVEVGPAAGRGRPAGDRAAYPGRPERTAGRRPDPARGR